MIILLIISSIGFTIDPESDHLKHRLDSICLVNDQIKCELEQSRYQLDSVTNQMNNLFMQSSWQRYNLYDKYEIIVPKRVPTHHFDTMMSMISKYPDIDTHIYFKLIKKESNFNKSIKSKSGAFSYMQVMPTTYNYLVKKYFQSDTSYLSHTPINNIRVGSFYLNWIHSQWTTKYPDAEEDTIWEITLASYNAGIGRVQKAGDKVPNIPETKDYIAKIMYDKSF